MSVPADTTKSNLVSDIQVSPSEPVAPSNNLRILYITFAVIVGLFILWIIIVIATKEDPVKVLTAMTDLAAQIKPVSDLTPLS